MFDNIGKKIKVFAKVIAWAGIVCSIVFGIVIFTRGDTKILVQGSWGGYYTESYYDDAYIFYGLLCMVLGSIFSWISAFFTYGFGELIDKTCDIQKSLEISHKKERYE